MASAWLVKSMEEVSRSALIRDGDILQARMQERLKDLDAWLLSARLSGSEPRPEVAVLLGGLAPLGVERLDWVWAGKTQAMPAVEWQPDGGAQSRLAIEPDQALLQSAERTGAPSLGVVQTKPSTSPEPVLLAVAVIDATGRVHGWWLARVDLVRAFADLVPETRALAMTVWMESDGSGPRLLLGQRELSGAERALRWGGQRLRLQVQASPQALPAWAWPAGLLLATGLGLSLGLAVWSARNGARQRKALETANATFEAYQQRFESLAASGLAIWLCDRNGRLHWANQAAMAAFGPGGSKVGPELELGEPPLLERLQPLPSTALNALRKAWDTGDAWQGDVCRALPPGGEQWLHLSLAAASAQEGASRVLIGLDVSQQHAERARWLERQHRQDEVMAAIHRHTLITVTDSTGLVLEANPRFCEISGYSARELVGSKHSVVSSRQHLPSFWAQLWTEIRAGRSWRGQICNRSKEGSLFWLDARITALFDGDGRIERYILVGFDISAQKLVHRELLEERARLGAIIEGMQAGTLAWHFQTGQVELNQRLQAFLGLANSQVAWTALRDRVHPSDRPHLQKALDAHWSGLATMFDLELRFQIGPDDWHWVQLRGAIVQRTPSGDPLVLSGTIISANDRRRAQEDERVRQILSAHSERLARVGAFELRLSDDNLTWSDQCFRLHELAAGHQPSLQQALTYIHPDDRDAFKQALAQVVQQFESCDLELRLVTALGRERWVRMVAEAEFDDSGPLRIIGAFQDISEHRQLQVQTQQQQLLLRSVLDSLPCGLSVFDKEMRLVAFNEALLHMLELPSDLLEIGQTRYQDLMEFNIARGEYGDGASAALAIAHFSELARDPLPHHFERRRPNGVTLDVRGAPMLGGGLVTTYIDISEAKRAEEAMRAQERFLRLVADSVPGRIAYWTRNRRCVFANKAYADWVGTTPERLLGANAQELGNPEWLAEQLTRAELAFAGESLRFEQWDAQHHCLLVHCEPDLSEASEGLQVHGVVVMALDISELKAVQSQTEELNAMLSVERDRANAASVAKSQFLATMSHEIRTPMNAILGMLRLLRRTALQPQQLDYVSKTEGAAKSLLGLLNDILDFSKVEAGKLALEQQPFALDEVFRALAIIMAANLGSKPVELVFDLDPGLPSHVVGDALRLQQVLINLCGNASKFTERGEVVLHVRLLGEEAGHARLGFAVQDSGIGIAADKLGTIFEGFSQAEASTTRRFGGTGLGLAISQRLVRLMGGELSVSSEPGQGSVFSFALELAIHAASEPAALESQRVLLVEPHPMARAALQALLLAQGMHVVAVESAAQASEMAAQDAAFDVIWTAAKLPDGDGWDCGQALRAQFARQSRIAPRWLLAGGAVLREQLSGRAAGPDRFVLKPLCVGLVREALGAVETQASPMEVDRGQALRGVRLLVVEDNPNNQQVAQELLLSEGASVTLADDGAQALEHLRGDRFDAVLMDMQMPVMDGLTATREIRNQLGLTELPIIAMTANALPADRDACLAAGMNAHVGKPFELEALVALLLKLTGRQSQQAAGPALRQMPSKAVPAEHQQRAMAQGLDLQTGMDRFLGRTSLYLRTAQSFATQARALPAALRQHMAVLPPELDAAQHALHSFKGLAATLAFERLAHWGRVGEQRARAGQALEPAWIDDLEAHLTSGLQLLLDEAQALHEPPAATAPSVQPVPHALQRLQTMVASEDLAVLQLVAEERSALEPWLGDDLEALESALAELDFAKARAVLGARQAG
ncbi:MAG: PAS domain S-box protein [Burkholderiales bacterium]